MQLAISADGPLWGEVKLPGDKSISHRAALFASLAQGESHINNFLVAGVTETMLDCVSQLGVSWEVDDNSLRVEGAGLDNIAPPEEVLDCRNSGTSMRLLTGALAGAGAAARLDGSAGLRRRPMRRIVRPLHNMGVDIQASSEGTAPLVLGARRSGEALKAIDYELPVASAQVKSAILLAALGADGPTTIREPGPSRDHSERMLDSMGVQVQRDGKENTVVLNPPKQPLRPLKINIPGDISSAAFLIVAALLRPGSEIMLREVGLNPTRTGFLEVLLDMGAQIEISLSGEWSKERYGNIKVRYSRLRATEVKGDLVVRMIDEFPAFAVAAAFAKGTTRVLQAEELRYKEADRITTLSRELRGLGIDIEEQTDGFEIHGRKNAAGGSAHAGGDHRLAMALSLVGMRAENPVLVSGSESIDESYPGFTSTLEEIGAQVRVGSQA